MPEPSQFRHYQIIQDAGGNHVELVRNEEQVAVLAFDHKHLGFVHCHVLLKPLKNSQAFDEACRRLQNSGSPLVARLVDFGEDDGNPFYITGNVDGETVAAYLERQQTVPVFMALMLACRALEATAALAERAQTLTDRPLENLRLLQNAPESVVVAASDYKLVGDPAASSKAVRQNFEKHSRALRSFLINQAGSPPALADNPVPAAPFAELLGACLAGAAPGLTAELRDLRAALTKLTPHQSSGELPSTLKPRTLLGPLLASHQEVARGVVHLVRIQSQRLDASNPYTMRGTLTKTGRTVNIEQVPPQRLCGKIVEEADRKSMSMTPAPGLARVVAVNEAEGITCMVEEAVEGISLAQLLHERRSLDINEGYLVLAGLDAALVHLETSAPAIRKLRLEDIFLLTGLPRDDARSSKLLTSPLNDWPAFSVVVRAHPTVASIAGRGVDPGQILAASAKAGPQQSSIAWHGAWLAALGRFLLGLEPLPGMPPQTPGNVRERDTAARLFDEEIAKCRTGTPGSRADFLSRYARIIQRPGNTKRGPLGSASPSPNLADRNRPVQKPPPASKPEPAPAPLTTGLASSAAKPSIGFAELLFQGAAESESHAAPPWSKTPGDAPPTIHVSEALLPPRDYVPVWLRASVFIGGSLVAGAIFAHLSGRAFWQKQAPYRPAPAVPAARPINAPPPTRATQTEPEVPIAPPVSMPRELPAEPPPSSGNLLTPPSGLKKQITQP